MKRILIAAFLFLGIISFIPSVYAPGSFFAGYGETTNITINNSQNANQLNNFQVPINVSIPIDEIFANFTNFRLTWVNRSSDVEREIPYWIENNVSNSSHYSIYLIANATLIPGNSYSDIIAYWNGTNLTFGNYANNGTLTFWIYDNFEYSDLPVNHGWSNVTTGDSNLGTSTAQSFRGSRSLFGDRISSTTQMRINSSSTGGAAIGFTDRVEINFEYRPTATTGINICLTGATTCGGGGEPTLLSHGGNNAGWISVYSGAWTDVFVAPTTNWHKYRQVYNITNDNFCIIFNDTSRGCGNNFVSLITSVTNFAVQVAGGGNQEDFYIDDFRVSNYTQPMPSTSFSSIVAPSSAVSITIADPANTTYLRNWAVLNFTVTGDSSTYNCTRVVSGNSTGMGNTTNNTYTNENLTSLNNVAYDISVSCTDNSGDSRRAGRNITIIHWNITDNISTSPIYETNWTSFRVNISRSSIVDSISARLFWNNTREENDTHSLVGDNFGFTSNVSHIPLLRLNNTGVTWYWSFNITYANGTAVNNQTTTAGNQSLLWAYYIDSYNSSATTMIEGQNLTVNSTMGTVLNFATLRSNITFNGTMRTNSSYTPQNLFDYFGYNLTTSLINVSSVSVNYNVTLHVTYNTSTRQQNSATNSLTINRIGLDNCTGGTRAIIFRNYNEEDFARFNNNFTMDATFLVWNNSDSTRNYSFPYSGNDTYNLCITPSTLVARTNATIEFEVNDTYPRRTYYLANANLDSTADDVNLYHLNGTLSARITFTVQDSSTAPIKGWFVKLLRYSPSTNSLATVEIGKTDPFGRTVLRAVQYDAFYKVLVEDGSTVKFESEIANIDQTSQTIIINPTSALEYFQYYNKIGYACAYTNSSLRLECTVSDTSGIVTRACLELYDIGPLTVSRITTTCQSGSSVTIGYTWASWSDMAGRTFMYKLYADTSGLDFTSRIFLLGRPLEFVSQSIFGLSGLLMAAFIVFTVAAMGFWNPAIAILYGTVALVAVTILDVITLPISGIASITFVGLVFVWRMMK